MNEVLDRLASAGSARAHLLKLLFLVLLCLTTLSPGITRLPVTDRDEARYVQATRQMAETGNYVDIRFQDKPRYLQPVGIYWLQSAAIILTGTGPDAPVWVNRLVSQAAAIVAVLMTYLAGTRLFGPAVGFIGAIGLAGIVMLNFEARIAKTDATVLAAAVTMQYMLAQIYLGIRQQKPAWRFAPWLFWIAVGCGAMVKGPIVPGIGLLTVVALSIHDRDLSLAKALRPVRGLLLVALIAAPWLIAITLTSGTTFWYEAIIKSLFSKIKSGQESHGFPPGYYFVAFTVFIWPFALESLRGGLKGLRAFRTDPRAAFCLAWIIPIWIVFELVPTKLPHYLLPTYPALLILAGWWLTDGSRDAPRPRWEIWLIRLGVLGWTIVTLGLAIACIAAHPYLLGRWSSTGLVAGILILIAGWLGSGFRAPFPSPVSRMLAASLAAGLAFGIMTFKLLPEVKSLWLGQEIGLKFHEVKPCPGSLLASSAFLEPSLVVNAGTRTILTDPKGAAAHLIADPASALTALRDDQQQEFRSALRGRETEVLAAISGFDYTKGTGRDIEILRIAP